MKPLLLILFCPALALASCLDTDDPAYALAVNQGNYDGAFRIVAHDLHISPDVAHHFKIIPGYSESHDDRHGQASPDSLELKLDPGLFQEGKNGACQGVTHELEHLKQFQRDRKNVRDYYAEHTPVSSGWDRCEQKNFGVRSAQQAEDDAYDCLQDDALTTHDAADEIEAVLAQLPLAPQRLLRDEDVEYLMEKLKAWNDNMMMVQDQSNVSYYLPHIKRHDAKQFCRGVHHIEERRMSIAPYYQAWQMYCRIQSTDY